MSSENAVSDRSLRRSLGLVTLSGCLCMVYLTGVNCPLQTEFFRHLGAREIHFGLLGGLPLAMMFMNFVGAALANRIRRRKPAFIILVILCRLLHLPVVFLPLVFPEWETGWLVGTAIALLSFSSALAQLSPPIWFSWMADLVPSPVLNRYWGHRQFRMMMVWVTSFLLVTLFCYVSPLSIVHAYPLLATIGVLSGVVDIVLFLWVVEPPNRTLPKVPLLAMLLAPLRHPVFRSYVVFRCVWSFCVMFPAAFMQLYVLKGLGLSLWHTTLIWCCGGVANGFAARVWGRLADRHGHRPIIFVCDLFKPMIVLVFCLVTPAVALPVLMVAFLFDGMLNSGNDIAGNGYMLKIAPRENRSMFIAAITGLAGICGGLGALFGGVFLERFSGFGLELAGRTWNNYQLMFFISAFLRAGCLLLLLWVKEPASHSPATVFGELINLGPLRTLAFPVGLYRWLTAEEIAAQEAEPTPRDQADGDGRGR